MKITIYSTPTCHYCHESMKYFDSKGIKYEEVDVSKDLEKRAEMVKISGQRSVPVIVIDEQVLLGWCEEKAEKIIKGVLER